MRQRCSGIKGWTSHRTLLLILTLDSYLHTPAKLLIGFRSGPAQHEKRDGLQPSMGDFGNGCTLSHLPEVFTKLIWHKQVGEEVHSSEELWFQFSLRGAAIKEEKGETWRRREVWHERNNGFLELSTSSHLIGCTSYSKRWNKWIRCWFFLVESYQQKQSSQSAAKGKLECCRNG